jgi:hypothetical protein
MSYNKIMILYSQKTRVVTMLLLLITICSNCKNNKTWSVSDTTNSKEADALESNSIISQHFNSEGVVSFNPTDQNLNNDFILLNTDGSNYLNLNFLDNEFSINGEIERFKGEYNTVFSPLEFYPDYYILKFELAKNERDSIWVYIDSNKEKVKLISKKSVESVEVLNWNDYFIGSVISFNHKSNPVRIENSDQAKSINDKFDFNDILFKIVQIEGEWIKISCAKACGFSCNTKSDIGWIKWKDGKKTLISFPSSC